MLRNLFKSDLPQLLAIENAVHVAPWNEETFKTCFEVGHIGWAMEIEKKMVGFVMVSLRSQECHILNLCVMHAHQHKGLGRQLLQHALNQAKQDGIPMAYLEVRRTNTRAISLYKNMQFQQVGGRKGYYSTVAGQEDALIFAKPLFEHVR